jgi:hypothetical protein
MIHTRSSLDYRINQLRIRPPHLRIQAGLFVADCWPCSSSWSASAYLVRRAEVSWWRRIFAFWSLR